MAYEVIAALSRIPREHYYCHQEFLRSLDHHSMRLISLEGEWRGMTSKLKLLSRYLHSGKHTGRYVLFADAFDLVFGSIWLDNPNDLWPILIERFKSFETGIVFNAEQNCFPFPEWADKFPDHGKKKFCYLNSGFYIGHTEAVVEMLRNIEVDKLPNDGERQDYLTPGDQEFVQLEFLRQKVPMKLDTDQQICAALHGVSPEEVDLMGPTLAWHMNGSAKTSGAREIVLKGLKL